MSLPFLLGDIKRHTQSFFMLSLVRLKRRGVRVSGRRRGEVLLLDVLA
jgi:hypothetical protein